MKLPETVSARFHFSAAVTAFAIGLSVAAATSQPAGAVALRKVSFATLKNWPGPGVRDGLAAFARSCRAMRTGRARWPGKARFGGSRKDWQPVCRAAAKLPAEASRAQSAAFLRRHFQPVAVRGARSLFTGYFEPELEGSLTRKPGYGIPLLRKPADLVKSAGGDGYVRRTEDGPRPYFTRRQIEEGALAGRGLELVWLKDAADAFFLHVQGSGRIRLDDGGVMRVGFAARNGRPYTPIGKVLIERGEIAREDMSMQAIRAWLLLHADQARELFWKNRSYIFFRRIDAASPHLGPLGAQGVQLVPGHSLAVDRRYIAYGTPVWLETGIPSGSGGALQPFAQLLVAQDTGTAIRGPARGDIFFGSGAEAGRLAGAMQSPGRLVLLLPEALARRLAR